MRDKYLIFTFMFVFPALVEVFYARIKIKPGEMLRVFFKILLMVTVILLSYKIALDFLNNHAR